MKKIIIIVICFITLCTSVLFISCSNNSSNNASTTSTSNNSNSNSSSSKIFTVDELKKYTGQNGTPAYVAVKGTVYEVTNAKKWSKGKHENGVAAGVDLTSVIGKSPHGESVLSSLPIVGQLK